MEWDDFHGDEPADDRPADEYELSAVEELAAFFNENRERVFFANQVAILHERKFFHWIAYRAIKELLRVGEIKTETLQLLTGVSIKLLWHKSHRYYRRDAAKVVALVNEYAGPNIGGALGLGRTANLRNA